MPELSSNPTRLFPLTEHLRTAWQLFRQRFGLLLGVTILPLLALSINSNLNYAAWWPAKTTFFAQNAIWIVLFLFQLWGQIAMLLVLDDRSGTGTIFSYYRLARPFYRHYFVLTVWVSLIVAGGLALLLIPGIALSVMLAFATYAWVLEHRRSHDALNRSTQLITGNAIEVFWRFIIISLLFILLLIFLSVSLLPVRNLFENIWVIRSVKFLLSLLSSMYLTAFSYILYRHLRDKRGEQVAPPPTGLFGNYKALTILGVIAAATVIVIRLLILYGVIGRGG